MNDKTDSSSKKRLTSESAADERARKRAAADIFGARVKVIMVDLLEFFEPNEALLWLVAPQSLLEQDVPFLLLQTVAGFRRVRAVVERLKDGAFV